LYWHLFWAGDKSTTRRGDIRIVREAAKAFAVKQEERKRKAVPNSILVDKTIFREVRLDDDDDDDDANYEIVDTETQHATQAQVSSVSSQQNETEKHVRNVTRLK
jgi:hypothetical protein